MARLAVFLLVALLVAAFPVSHQRPVLSSTVAEVESGHEPKPHPHKPPHRPDPEPEPKPDPRPEPEPEPEPEPKPDPRPEPEPEPKPPTPPKKLPRARLQDLIIPTGEELVPPFHPYRYHYRVNTTAHTISVRPVLADDEEHESFLIEVNDEIVSNDTESSKFELRDTTHVITVRVSAPEYRPSSYEISVNQVPPEHHRSNNKVWTVVWVVIVVAIVAILAALFYRATQRARAEGRQWPWSKEPASGAYGTLPSQEAEGARRI